MEQPQASRANAVFVQMLETDYELLQRAVDKFDGHRFQVKNWAVTTSGALFALGVGAQSYGLVLSGMLPVVFFGFLELVHTNMQALVIERSNAVERLLQRALRDTSFEQPEYRFGIGQVFEGPHPLQLAPGRLRGRPHITVLYLGLALANAVGGLAVALST